MINRAPLQFEPYLKSVIWGGNKLCSFKKLDKCLDGIGESWEISAVPGHESIVADGPYKGLSITELIDTFGVELLGNKVFEKYGDKFPLLIKFIDAADNLSVQVHPDDALAKQRHNSLGKTEMWYIVSADKGAKIFAGLNTAMTPDDYARRVADGTFAQTLAVHDSTPGDVFFLPAGRVHAIGAGNLLAEIQQSSDITYRIYDYDRRDANGNARELHTELAKDAIDYTVYDNYRSPRPAADNVDSAIVECDYFVCRKLTSHSGANPIPVTLTNESFTIVICVEGTVTLHYGEGLTTTLPAGHTALLPAAMAATGGVTLSGEGTALTTYIPA